MNNDLLKYCKNTTHRDDFVGIRFVFDDVESIYHPEISFPYGYHYTEKTLHDDILCLIKVLTQSQRKLEQMDLGHYAHKLQGFPVHSYMVIIQDYLQNGYYQEHEIIYTSRTSGKVNWGRTIKKERPVVQNNGAIYLKLQTRLHRSHDEHILTEISKHCVFESFSKFGWFYGVKNPACPSSHFNQSAFINILKNKLHHSNKDRDKQLFQSMINVLSNMDNHSKSNQAFEFGTTRFENVWEYLIEHTFGTEREDIKQQYYPKAQWHIINSKNPIDSSNLRPDTIMFDRENQKLYVIDAKYYRYGIIRDNQSPIANLPATSDITKQVLYAHHIATKGLEGIKPNHIRNVFAMPFNSKQSNDSVYQYIGYAHLDWFDSDDSVKEYTKVYAVLIDTKYLMKNLLYKNVKEIKKLSEIIEHNL